MSPVIYHEENERHPCVKELLLHIGTEKTGTKSIQLLCTHNHSFLKEHGVCYPIDESASFFKWTAHWPIAAAFSENKGFVPVDDQVQPKEIFQDLDACIRGSKVNRFFLSAEPISAHLTKKRQVKALASVMKKLDANVKVLIYFRPQLDYFLSLISTYVKGGQRLPGSSAMLSTMEGTPLSIHNPERYDYFAMYKMWTSYFGKNNIIARPYEKRGKEYLEEVLGLMGIEDTSGITFPADQNRSLSLEALLFLNELNASFASPGYRATYLEPLQVALSRMKGQRRIQELIPSEVRDEVQKLYQPTNRKLAKELGWATPLPTGSLANPLNESSSAVVSPDELARIIAFLKESPSAKLMDELFSVVMPQSAKVTPLIQDAHAVWAG